MKHILLLVFVFLIYSCVQKPICVIDNESLYFSQGISNDFTIELISVSKFDTSGAPEEYTETTVRTEFINEASKKMKKVYFFKKNPNSHWNYQFSGRFNTLPINFENGKWYLITSKEFKKGIFKNIHFWFFVYKDSSNQFHLFQSSEAVSPV